MKRKEKKRLWIKDINLTANKSPTINSKTSEPRIFIVRSGGHFIHFFYFIFLVVAILNVIETLDSLKSYFLVFNVTSPNTKATLSFSLSLSLYINHF